MFYNKIISDDVSVGTININKAEPPLVGFDYVVVFSFFSINARLT